MNNLDMLPSIWWKRWTYKYLFETSVMRAKWTCPSRNTGKSVFFIYLSLMMLEAWRLEHCRNGAPTFNKRQERQQFPQKRVIIKQGSICKSCYLIITSNQTGTLKPDHKTGFLPPASYLPHPGQVTSSRWACSFSVVKQGLQCLYASAGARARN